FSHATTSLSFANLEVIRFGLKALLSHLNQQPFSPLFQTRLLLSSNKASLHCKQGFFTMQTRLLLRPTL
uniref:hypothetical protein n=1 Tax=Prevotella sp. TaxID=59823 RepID=UPI003FED7A8F